VLAVILYVVAIVLGVPVIWEVAQTGLVPRFPTAIALPAVPGSSLIDNRSECRIALGLT